MSNSTHNPAIAAAVSATTPTFAGGWYAVNKAKDSDEAEVSIFDAIGAFGISAEQFVRDIKAIKAQTINVHINTPGGEVFDATTIYNALKEHPARVVTNVVGVAASSGSFIAVAGDEVRMADNAYMMIHDASGGVMGGSEDLRRYAGLLDMVNDNIAGIYEKKTGKPRDHWRGLMTAETWFTAEEAKAQGLIDEVYAAAKKTPAVKPVKATFDVTIYNKIPEPVRAMWGIAQHAPPRLPGDGTTPVIPQQNNQAPEDSPTLVEPPPAVSLQEATMPTDTQAAPAQNPAAVATPNPPRDVTIDAAEAHRREMDRLKGLTAEAQFEAGRAKGIAQGRQEQTEKFKAILAVCPGKPDMAINSFLADQPPESVKIAYDAVTATEAAAAQRDRDREIEIERWRNLAAIGGHPGVTDLGYGNGEEGNDAAPALEPKTQAEQEWDHKPGVRNGFSSKANYVAFRARQLSGTFAMQTAGR